MPQSIDWYIKDEVIFARFYGETTLDELKTNLQAIQSYTKSSSRPLVHAIVDVGDVTKAVPPKQALDVVREVGSDERTGWMIILREQSILVKLGVAFGTSIFKSRTRTFDTLEQATEFLKQQDETINWDNVQSLDWIP